MTVFMGLLDDVRVSGRLLAKSPAVTAVAVVLTALVVGGNSTIYSIVHSLIAKPAPGVRADRLVTLNLMKDGAVIGPEHSYPNYLDYVAQSQTVRPLMAYAFDRFTVATATGVYAVRGAQVSANYFETLGLEPMWGRFFTEAPKGIGASTLPVVVSDRFCQRQLHVADQAIGQAITVNGHPATITGVAPPGFRGATLGESADIWVPLLTYARVHGTEGRLRQRTERPVIVMGRLALGLSLAEARAEFTVIAARLRAAYPEVMNAGTVDVTAYSMLGTGSPIRQLAPHFMAVFSIVAGLTLIIVCANVANLMLARAVARRRELAIQQALGASQVRIMRLLLVEGALIALLSWVVAYVFTLTLTQALGGLIPPDRQGSVMTPDFRPDWRVAFYALILALTAGLVFTVAPAMRAWRQDASPALRAGEQSIIQGRSRLSNVLVLAQLAFSVLLLTSAGLAYRSLASINELELGFNKENLWLVTVNTAGSATTKDENLVLVASLRDRVHEVAGVRDVSYATGVPGVFWAPESLRRDPSQGPVRAHRNDVGPGFLRVLGVAPLLGRDLPREAGPHAPRVAVINQYLADALWPSESPIGRTVLLKEPGQSAEIVGVIPNGFFSGFERETRPHFVFLLHRQQPPDPGEITLYVRTAGGKAGFDALAPAIRAALRKADERVPIVYVRTMDTQLQSVTWLVRVVTILLTLFATVAVLIAGLGQYSMMAFAIRRRLRDFALRMALGASASQIIRSVLREGLRLTGAGLLIGFGLSVLAGRAFRTLLFGVAPVDGLTYATVFAMLGFISLLACYVPARRAARVDPAQILRHD